MSGCACVASQNISLKRRERDAEPVGRMLKGGLCPLRASGFQEPSLRLRRVGTHTRDRNGELFSAFADSLPSSTLLFLEWKLEIGGDN